MTRRTRVRAIEGRVLEAAIIHPPDFNERIGPSLELRFSGGIVFAFDPVFKHNRLIVETSVSRDEKGNLVNRHEQEFE